MTVVIDGLLAGYLLLASLTIWCAQANGRQIAVKVDRQLAGGPQLAPRVAGMAVLRIVEPCLASLPHALGSLGCLIAALALLVGTPFDIHYAAISAFAVALYLVLVNLSHLIDDWRDGVAVARMLCVRSLLPALLASPMLLAGLRLL